MSTRPLPDVTEPLTAPFWAGLREGQVRVPKCLRCGRLRWPSAPLCPDCLAQESNWVPVTGHGEVWSYVVYRRALAPAFADDVPYAIAVVALDEQPDLHVLARIRAPWESARIGARVEPAFTAVSEDVTLLEWVLL